MQGNPTSRFALVALLAGAVCIGFAPIFVRWSEVGPSATAFYRVLFALPFLSGWRAWEARRTPCARRPAGWKDHLMLALCGLFFALDLSLWHWSIRFTSVANATLFANLAPLFVTLGARWLLGERITPRFLFGMVLAFPGVALVVGDTVQVSRVHLRGDILGIVTALFYAGYMLFVKHLRQTFSTATIMAWSGTAACVAMLGFAILSGEDLLPARASGWWALIGLAMIGQVGGQSLITYAFAHLPASFGSLSLLSQPVVAAVLAWQLLGESLSIPQGLGGVVVLAAIGLARGRR